MEGTGAGDNGVYVREAGGNGVYVWKTGGDGVYVDYAIGDGVYANTLDFNNEWGFYTPDKIYAGASLASGGPMMFVAQNGDSGNLERGDVVAVGGRGAAFAGSDAPVPLLQKAGQANSAAVVGVVYGRFVVEEEVEEVEVDGQVER